jgi:hypothetical protein
MYFNIICGNHGEKCTQIEDLVRYFYLALRQAGYRVEVSSDIEPLAMNILFESFNAATVDVIIASAKAGVKFIIVATEFVTNGTFNFFENAQDSSWYSSRAVWDERYLNFIKVMGHCHSIWCLTKEQYTGYSQILPSSLLHKVPIGYLENYAPIEHHPDAIKDIDFLFTGTMTERRRQILLAFTKQGMRIRTCTSGTPNFIRESSIARSKICLGMRQLESWSMPSLIRYYYHLMANSMIISEKCDAGSEIDDYITTVDSKDYIAFCIDFLKSGQHSSVAKKNHEKFRDEMPLKTKINEFLHLNNL